MSTSLRVHGRRFWFFFFLFIVLFAAALGFYLWTALRPRPLQPSALRALRSTPDLQVLKEPWGYLFRPKGPLRGGFIFYPAARVDERAYAPILRQIAQAHYLVADFWMPFGEPLLGPERASQALALNPKLPWAIGGQGAGGVAAAEFARQHPKAIRALVLWASLPQGSLRELQIPTLALYGTRDGLIPLSIARAQRSKLPPQAKLRFLPGIDHAGFGDYGEQSGDLPETIAKRRGWKEIAQATVGFLETVLK
jgi:pimeloyl-ACP methyl ester carboxylesterase